MPKATAADVINLGFNANQFGGLTDFATEATGYVAVIVSDVALEVENEVGSSVYAAADSGGTAEQKLNFKRLKMAEIYLSAAELWRRLESFERGQQLQALSQGGTETIGSRALNTASKFEQAGWDEVENITGSPRAGGISVGTVETGMYSSLL